MADALKFEVRPIEGAVAVVGEAVTFRREDDKFYALNEDGEAFGRVPGRRAEELAPLLERGYAAEVVGREGGVPIVEVAAAEPVAAKEQAEESVASTAQIEPIAQAVPAADEATEEAGAEDDAAVSDAADAAVESPVIKEGWSPQGTKKLPAWAKAALVVLAVIVVIVLVAAAATSGSAEATQTVTVGHVEYEVPGSWTAKVLDVDEDDLNEYYYGVYAGDFDGGILIQADCPSDPYFTEYALPYLLSGMGIEDDPIDEYTTDEGACVYLYEGLAIEGESQEGTGYLQVVVSGDYATMTYAYCTPAEYDEHADELLEILDTLTIIDAEEPSYSQAQDEEDTQSVTLGSVTIEVPESWTLEDTSYSSFTQTMIKADDFDATVFMTFDSYEVAGDMNSMDIKMSLLETDYDFGSPSVEYSTTEGFVCRYEREPDDDNDRCYEQLVVSESSYLDGAISKYRYVEISIFCAPDDFDLHAEELEAILDSMTIEDDEDEAA